MSKTTHNDHRTRKGRLKLLGRIRERKYLAIVLAVVVVAKVLLATFTPASKEVLFYLRIGTVVRSAELLAGSPWGQWYSATLTVWNALPIKHSPVTDISRSKLFLLDPSLHILLLLVKLPLLLADLVVGLTVYGLARRIWGGTNRAVYVAMAWLANPYVTFATEMLGAVDIVPVMALMLGIYFMVTRTELFGSLSLAAGVALKLFPIVLVPAFLLFMRERGTRSVKVLLYGLVMITAGVVYFSWARNPAFLFGYTPVTQPITEFVLGRQSLLHYGIGDFIGLSTLSVVIVYLVLYEFHHSDLADLMKVGILVLLAYLAFLEIQVQYVLWIAPLLTLGHLSSRRTTTLISTAIYATAFLIGLLSSNGYSTDSGLSLLFVQFPMNQAIFSNELVRQVFSSVLRTLLAGSMIVLVALALGRRADLLK